MKSFQECAYVCFLCSLVSHNSSLNIRCITKSQIIKPKEKSTLSVDQLGRKKKESSIPEWEVANKDSWMDVIQCQVSCFLVSDSRTRYGYDFSIFAPFIRQGAHCTFLDVSYCVALEIVFVGSVLVRLKRLESLA